MFTAVDLLKESKSKPIKIQFDINDCYTINEISEKFGVSLKDKKVNMCMS